MKILCATKISKPIFLFFVFSVFACGQQPDPVYDEELKDYGQNKSGDANPGIEQVNIDQPISQPNGGMGSAPLPMGMPGDDAGNPNGDDEQTDGSLDTAGEDGEETNETSDDTDGSEDANGDGNEDGVDGGSDDNESNAEDGTDETDGTTDSNDASDATDSQSDGSDDDSDGVDGGSSSDAADGGDSSDGSGDGIGDGIIIGDDGDDDSSDGIEEPPPIPPETLISSNWLRAYFDQDSAVAIQDGKGTKSLGQIEDKVKAKLTNEPSDGVRISQTFGDGVSTSLNSQSIFNSAGDTNRDEGAPTVSGTQFMDRIVTADCPGVFLCISRMWFVPNDGETVTYCFADPATGESKPFPYGPLPNYKAVDFDPYYGIYGPYNVSRHAGQVSCNDPGPALITEEINVSIYADTVEDLSFQLHVFNPIPPQYGLIFENARTENDLSSPYIDETVQMNTKTRYALNEDHGEIIKLIVTARQTIDVAAEAGGGPMGRWIASILKIDGLKVDLHFEYCNNLLSEGYEPHCDAPYEPVE